MLMNNIIHFLLALFAPSKSGIMMASAWRTGRGKWIIATVAVATVAVAGTAIVPKISNLGEEPPASVEANVWLSPSGSDSCGRSVSQVSFQNSPTVCRTWNEACDAASGGDTVGVKAGVYPAPPNARYITSDCSHGTGQDVDPTQLAAGTTPQTAITGKNWVSFVCGDGETRDTVTGQITGNFDVNSNAHIDIHGNCFYWRQLLLGEGGNNTYETQNVIVDGWHVQGYEVVGSKNIWIRNIEDGPSIQCGDTSYVVQFRCQDPGYGTFESEWAQADKTSADYVNGQGYVHQNLGVGAQNILLENIWEHDQQSRRSSSYQYGDGGWHTGCLQLDNGVGGPWPTDNVIVRNFTCERVAHIAPLIEAGTSGVTIENFKVPCPVEPLDNNTGQWATPACNQLGPNFKSDTCANSNILIRYSDFTGLIRTNTGDCTGKNIRIIGNIAPSLECTTGVTFDSNVTTGTNCGSNQHVVGAMPYINSNPGTSCCATSIVTNFHLDQSYPWERSITTTGGDYALAIDSAGNPRTAGQTTPGAYEP